jgi:cytochrome c-type biogenesis protein
MSTNTLDLNRRFTVLLHAFLFVLGFSLIFVVGWGGAATLLGRFFGTYKDLLGKVGGIVVILLGFATMGMLKIPWLYYDTRPQWGGQRRRGFWASGLMGIFFAAGWTPCVGTTLGAILTLGFSQETAGQAMLLSSGYALGLGLPFLAIGASIDRASSVVNRLKPYMRQIQIANGIFLIIIGVMMLTDQIIQIAIWAQRSGLYLDIPMGTGSVPTYLIAIAAGLISFISPCVLPLVPAYIGYLSSHAFGKPLEVQQL